MEFSHAAIAAWRSQATERWEQQIPAQPPQGWSLCPVDPATILPAFPRLNLRPEFRLQAYQYRWGHDGHACVYALPAAQDLPPIAPETQQLVHPAGALPDPMEAMGGDGSLEAYLQASILARELQAFLGLGHGVDWGFSSVLGEEVWSDPGEVSPQRVKPAEDQRRYQWSEKMPVSYRPRAEQSETRVKVTLYVYRSFEVERILRVEDTFASGRYAFQTSVKVIAQGNLGFRI